MAANRRAKLANALAKKSHPSLPPQSGPMLNANESSLFDAKATAVDLREQIKKAGVDLKTFLCDEFNIQVANESVYQISTPYNGEYSAVAVKISAEDIKNKVIISDKNIRLDSARTPEALADIYDDIANGCQLTPVIAYINEKGQIVVIDGSRRTACAILSNRGLTFIILNLKPTEQDQSWIVESSDKQKAFSYYELGSLYTLLMNTHEFEKQSQLVAARNLDKAKVSISLAIYNMPEEIYPSYSMSRRQAQELIKIWTNLKKNFLQNVAIDKVKKSLPELEQLKPDERFAEILKTLKNCLKSSKNIEDKQKPTELFVNGKTRIVLQTKSKNRSAINLEMVPDDMMEGLMTVINDYLKENR